MSDKKIVVWGAGKIGRGFVGHLFHRAGWGITFVDDDSALADRLSRACAYTVHLSRTPGLSQTYTVSGFAACACDSPQAARALSEASLVALAVFPDAFAAAASALAAEINRRSAESPSRPLDILICANVLHAATRLRRCLEPLLSPASAGCFASHVGLVESLVLRVAVEPSEEQRRDDALCVMTNGYPDLTAARPAFRGPLPQIEGLRLSDTFAAEEVRKLYTYNLLHAVYAYVGSLRGHRLVSEACADPEVDRTARGALRESGRALVKEFGFSGQEMESWNSQAIADLANPLLGDTLERLGADPARKLGRSDRVTGPALLCHRHGIRPWHLSRVMAAALVFGAKRGAWELSGSTDMHALVRSTCNLTHEPELVQLVVENSRDLTSPMQAALSEARVALVDAAYEEGYRCERTYKGCAQCTILALSTVREPTGEELFQAASGLSGGMALCGDGVCGGYAGGILYMGSRVGRRRSQLAEGDKDRQYQSYEMAQKLHDRFVETYGSVICSDIHRQIFGMPFCLRAKPVREQFEKAGAHVDKCTSVIATACGWVAELLAEDSRQAPPGGSQEWLDCASPAGKGSGHRHE